MENSQYRVADQQGMVLVLEQRPNQEKTEGYTETEN